MFSNWKKTSPTKAALNQGEEDRHRKIRLNILDELSGAVKQLQREHINDFEIEKGDMNALHICNLLEALFLHGFHEPSKISHFTSYFNSGVTSNTMPTISFWNFLANFTHKDVISQLAQLPNVSSDIGKCRAWIRLAMNDCLMEGYLDSMMSDHKKISQYYSAFSSLLDPEVPAIMKSYIHGITDFQFNMNYNSPILNTWSTDSLTLAGLIQAPQVTQAATIRTQAAPTPANVLVSRPVHKGSLPRSVSLLDPDPVSDQEDNTHFQDSTSSNDSPAVSSPSWSQDSPDAPPVPPPPVPPPTEEMLVENVPETLVETADEIENKSTDKLTAVKNEEESIVYEVDDTHQVIAPKQTELHPGTHPERVRSPSPLPGSNKLSADARGWSSSFESTPEPPSPSQRQFLSPALQQESFGSLLKDYVSQGNTTSFPQSVYDGDDVYGEKQRPFSSKIQRRDDNKENKPEINKRLSEPGFEVLPISTSIHSDERTQILLSIITEIANEKGLDYQNFQCQGCCRPIGMIYGEAKVCSYNGRYYCFECHIDEEHIIPARVIHNWDFRKFKVTRHTKLFLLQIDEEPLFHLDESNPTLYNVIPELNNIKMLRNQLQHLKGYIMTCKESIGDDMRRRIWPREYLWDDLHQYSLLDLVQVQSGQLEHHLKKINSQCIRHVYRCRLCCQKGFICEICNNPKIIYPFEIQTTIQCIKCKACYHKSCKTDQRCPKCVRRRIRQASSSNHRNQVDVEL